MHAPERIAILISTYNRPRDLALVLASLARQDDLRFSVYVADDGSTNETRSMLKALAPKLPFPLRHIWHPDQGFRLAEIRNRAIVAATDADYLIVIDGDCLAPPAFVRTHRRLAQTGCFITGSRLLLRKRISEALRNEALSLHELFSWKRLIRARLRGEINRLWPLWIPAHTRACAHIRGLRGCHMAFWREDLLRVNGYDHGYRGWGREDSDLAARLLHAGVRRLHLRGMPLLHLWHPEAERASLAANDARLSACLREKRIRAPEGIEELR